MIVDVQQHYVPPSLLEAYRAAGTGHGEREDVRDPDLRLDDLDGAGVDYAVLSIPVLDRYDHDPETVAALAARWNDELLEAVERHPDRFGALALLPFPSPGDCVRELERVQEHAQVRGIIVFATTKRWTLDERRFEDVFQAIADAGLVVLVHPSEEDLASNPVFAEWSLRNWIPPLVETSTAVARMMLSGMLDRVRGLTLVVPHLGGLLPYLAQRAVDQSGDGDAEHDLLHYLRTRCLLDSCSYHQPALACALATVGASRIVLGSDYPFRGSVRRAVADVESAPLALEERSAILGDTAVRYGLGRDGRRSTGEPMYIRRAAETPIP